MPSNSAKLITILLILINGFSFYSSAQTNPIFKEIKPEQPICYGREYSESHLKSHAKQTVRAIKAKLSVNDEYNTNDLTLEIILKNKPNKTYLVELMCRDNVSCVVPCDSGSVDLSIKDNKLIIKNNGIAMSDECDGEEAAFLKAIPKGDDVFHLSLLPNEFCQK